MGAAAQMYEKEKEKSADFLAKGNFAPINIEKGNYNELVKKVSGSTRMTAFSYNDYYLKYYPLMEKLGMSEKDKFVFMSLLGMHKASGRAIAALETDGINWRNSTKLSASDKFYINFAEDRFKELETKGISLDTPLGEVLEKTEKGYGPIGQRIVEYARLMPIFGKVVEVNEKNPPQEGDVVFVFKDGRMRAIRDANVGATVMLLLVTSMTCQGKTVEQFEKIAKNSTEDTFSESSDYNALKKKGYSDEKIETIKRQKMFSEGAMMFTEGRFDDMLKGVSNVYVAGAQLSCEVTLCANLDRFVEGKPEEIQLDGYLTIMRGKLPVTPSDEHPTMKIAIRSKTTALKPVYDKATKTWKEVEPEPIYTVQVPIDKATGEFSLTLTKKKLEELGLKAGQVTISADYESEGKVLGERVACGSWVPLNVEKQEIKISEEKKPKLQIGITLWTPKNVSALYEFSKESMEWIEKGGKGKKGHPPHPPFPQNISGHPGEGHGWGKGGTPWKFRDKDKWQEKKGETTITEELTKGSINFKEDVDLYQAQVSRIISKGPLSGFGVRGTVGLTTREWEWATEYKETIEKKSGGKYEKTETFLSAGGTEMEKKTDVGVQALLEKQVAKLPLYLEARAGGFLTGKKTGLFGAGVTVNPEPWLNLGVTVGNDIGNGLRDALGGYRTVSAGLSAGVTMEHANFNVILVDPHKDPVIGFRMSYNIRW